MEKGGFMNKKILLQVAMFVSLFSVNGMVYGINRTLDYGDGVIYEGEVEYKELPDGGRFNFTNWIIYKFFGVMEAHGNGKLTFREGDFYEGNFIHGRMTGRGKRTFTDGSFVEGDFVNGNVHGRGKYTFSDGNFYEGYFSDGEMTGKGKIVGVDGSIIQEGIFLMDKELIHIVYL